MNQDSRANKLVAENFFLETGIETDYRNHEGTNQKP